MLPAIAVARGLPDDPVARTASAMGGQRMLDRITAIAWVGAAEVVTPERTLRLGMRTRVEPFVRARSDSWIIKEGTAATRSLIIEPDGGWGQAPRRASRPAAGQLRNGSDRSPERRQLY
ncbi:MAG: hypothetical protein ACRECS_18595, partial [Sphingomonas sp.]